MQRIKELDAIKAIAILLVVYAHNDIGSDLNVYVHSFVLALFFITSGMVHKGFEPLSFKAFLIKNLKRLIVPYFLLSLGLYIFWYVLGRHYGESAEKDYEPLKNFIGIFYAQGGSEYMNWGIPMWFLPAMFMVLSIEFAVSRIRNNCFVKILASGFVISGGIALRYLLPFRLPWSLDVSLIAYGFFILGHLVKRYNLPHLIKGRELIIGTSLLILNILTYRLNGKVDMYYGLFGNSILLMYFNGIITFLWIFAFISLVPNYRFLIWAGANTLLILALHIPAMTVIKAFAFFVLNLEIHFNTWNSQLLAMLQIILLVPAVYLINRFIPILAGIEKKKHSDHQH